MIKAIIFDCFGVLTTDSWLPFKAKYFGHDPSLMEQATNLNKQTNAGLISYNDFLQAVAALAGTTASEAHLDIANNIPNKPLFKYIKELKDGYKIGMLSNAADNWLEVLFSPSEAAVFDVVALSYEMGFVKPDPRAYRVVVERLGVSLDECVFIDDQERQCVGAREVGMHAITYRDVDQVQADLGKLIQSEK